MDGFFLLVLILNAHSRRYNKTCNVIHLHFFFCPNFCLDFLFFFIITAKNATFVLKISSLYTDKHL